MVDSATRRRFETLVSAAYADGVLAEEEKLLLQRKAEEMSLSSREVADILSLGQQGKLSGTLPGTVSERESLLDDLIDVVTADGKVEAAEYHVLARLAQTLKLSLPELRARVSQRLRAPSGGRPEPRRETVRTPPREDAAPALYPRPAANPTFKPPPAFPEAPPPAPVGPVKIDTVFAREPAAAGLPPVTLQLLKQSIMFDSEADSLVYIGRTLGVAGEEAAQVRAAILAAYPDLKPGSSLFRPRSAQ